MVPDLRKVQKRSLDWLGRVVTGAGNIAIKPLTAPLMRRFGIRRVLVGNGVLSVVCFGALALISSTTPDVVIAVALLVSGALRSIGFTAYNSVAFAEVDSGELTDANTLHATLQELASGLGIALSALVITLCTPLRSRAISAAERRFR